MRGVLIFSFCLAGCGGNFFDGARQTLAGGAATITTGFVALKAVDDAAKDKILKDVEKLCTGRADAAKCVLDESDKRFANLVAKRTVASKAIRGATVVVHEASVALPQVEAGVKARATLTDWLMKLPVALVEVAQAIADIMQIVEE